MEHKLLVAKSLRDGLAWLKLLCEIHFRLNSPFYANWAHVAAKQSKGIDFDEHKLLIEDEFSRRSHALYLRLKMKSGRTGD